jgi:hypothetical protein
VGGIRAPRVLILLLLVPSTINFVAPLYDISAPSALGLPFFYWFQIVMLQVSAIFYPIYSYIQKDSAEGPR